MKVHGKTLLLLALSLVISAPTPAFALFNYFKIKPYVFLEHGEYVTVGWQYRGKEPQKQRLNIPPCGFADATYQIKGMNRARKIQSLPCPGSLAPVRFAFLADTQEGVDRDAVFASLVHRFNNMAVVYGGDLVQNGNVDGQWEDFFKATDLLNSDTLMIPAIGNHEYHKDVQAGSWKKYFNYDAASAYYSSWIGDVHLIVLNSNFEIDKSLIFNQLPWLESELQKPARWKVIAFHHPPYSKSIMHEHLYPRKEYLFLQENYVPLFEKYKVDVVLNGHTHIYEHSFKNGIHYITTGAAGGKMGHLGGVNPFELTTMEERSAIQFEVSQDTFRSTAYTIDGKTLDDIIIKK